jgi:hypothetical protein
LQQLSLKARNKLMRLSTLDRETMERYLTECHGRGVLTDLLPALADSVWRELAVEILGLTTSDSPRQSVSDYDDLMSQPPDEGPEKAPAPEIPKETAEESAPVPRAPWVNWGALLARVMSLLTASIIALVAFSLVIAVAGALHPPIWNSTEALIAPWIDEIMLRLDRLLQYLPH